MKKAANAQLRMLNAVVNFLDQEVEQINQIPRLAEKHQALKSLLQSIRELSKEKSINIKGVTVQRDELRERVNFVGIQLSGILVSYAREKSLTALEVRVKFCPSELSATSVNKNLDFLQTLLISAEELGAAELESYGWNQGRLDAYRRLVEEFALKMTAPREAIVTRSMITNEVYTLLNQAHDLLHIDIDPLMLLFTDEHSRMVEEYFAVCTVVKPGTRSMNLLDEVSAPSTLEPADNSEETGLEDPPGNFDEDDFTG